MVMFLHFMSNGNMLTQTGAIQMKPKVTGKLGAIFPQKDSSPRGMIRAHVLSGFIHIAHFLSPEIIAFCRPFGWRYPACGRDVLHPCRMSPSPSNIVQNYATHFLMVKVLY
jgi:hypothetical protein